MFKSTLLASFALLLCLSAQAGSYIRTHEDFVHLSDYEKNQMIIKTMELVVVLESQYNYEVKKYGFNTERYEKFVKAVSKIKSILFIDSAYAVPPAAKKPMSDWNSYGNAFKKLMEKSGSNCFFAGWPSKPYVLGGKTYCGHPDFIQGENASRHSDKPMAEWTQYYPEPKSDSGCGINDRKKIQCNPAIFGFKHAGKKDLFCVTASDGAHNSAYNCMQEALKVRPENDANFDSPDKRLGDLRTALGSNPGAFEAVQKFVYKTCVCDSTPSNFNKDYQTYVRKHRTCYGMMEMVGKVSCGSTLPIDTSIFTSLQNYAKDKILYNEAGNTSETMVDHHYEQFIKNEVKKTATAEYNRLCGASIAIPDVPIVVAEKKYACSSAKCSTAAGAEGAAPVITCTYDVHTDGKADEKATFTKEPTELPAVGATGALEIKPEIESKVVTLSCPLELTPLTVVVEEKEYICASAKCTTAAAPEGSTTPVITCTYDVHLKGKADEKAVFTTAPTEVPAVGATGSLAISGQIDGKAAPLSCPLELTPLPEVKTDEPVVAKVYECKKAECSPVAATRAVPGLAGSTDTPASFTCSLEINEQGKTEKISKTATPEGTPENGKSSSFKVALDKEETLSCPVTVKSTPVVPPKIEPKAEPVAPTRLGGQAPMNQGPPRPQIRGSSDTSAIGIK